MASTFRGIIEFFGRLGIYDVVLPFLLVFTIVFAIMEKTKVFGMDGKYTRKNLNSMTAFVIAFLVVASSRLVAIINQAMAQMVLLLLISVSFLILVGSFMKPTKEGIFLEGIWKTIFMVMMFIGIMLIFMHALGWLEPFWGYLVAHYDSNVVGSIILIGVIVGFMYWITKDPSKSKESSDS